MKKNIKKVPSPFSTGGGGTRFEWLVATSYLVALLRGETPRGLSTRGAVIEVRFQQRAKDYSVDDLVVVFSLGTHQGKLALQVKHNVRLTVNDLFNEIMAACWRHFRSRTFDKNRDFVGIAIGEGCNIAKVRVHVQELLEWARTSSRAHSFFMRVSRFREKHNCLKVFEKSIRMSAGRQITKTQLWHFLRRFVIIPFDFDHPTSRDSTDCWNGLQGLIRRRRAVRASELFHSLYELASRYSKDGGELNFDSLRAELAENLPINCVPDICAVKAALVQQVRRQLEKEIVSKKYIPNVFTEIHTVKDSTRLFSHPSLFLQKTMESARKVDTSFINRILVKFGIQPPVKISLPKGFVFSSDVSRISFQYAKLISHFDSIALTYQDYARETWGTYERLVPPDKKYIFDQAKYLLRGVGYSLHRSLKELLEELRKGKSRVLLLTSRAGQGKTCFVCDLAENFLLLRGLPCLLITGREFRNVPAGHLDKYITSLVMGADFDGGLSDFLRLVGDVCEELNSHFTIIFDGINEHSQIVAFSQEVEHLIERILQFPFVKIILTCRSEYFIERFANIKNSSFANDLYHIGEIQRDMSFKHGRHMVSAYFKFYKIDPEYVSGKVFRSLAADPLLLRFFCEAYGDPESRVYVRLPSMPDIYREVVFRLYLEKKLQELTERQNLGFGVGIQLNTAYKEVLRALVSIMITKKIFSDIPISDLDERHHIALGELIAEDVFLRKDILEGKSVLDPESEVINFTFDEFRDYLLADHLLKKVWPEVQPTDIFTNLVLELTERTCPVAEGVSRYLFYAEKRLGDEKLSKIMRTMPWYDKVFADCIFSLEEQYVTEDDIEKIRDAFMRDAEAAQYIFLSLMVRWDTDAMLRLNINLLFEMMDSLGDEQYNGFVRPIFEGEYDKYDLGRKPQYAIGRLASDIEHFVGDEKDQWDRKSEKVLELLIYLFPIMGEDCDSPAFDVFQRIAEKNPEQSVSLLSHHISTPLPAVRARVWEMLAELTSKSIAMPEFLIKEAEDRLVRDMVLTLREKTEICRFLKSCVDRLGVRLSDAASKLLPIETDIFDFLRKQ